MARWSGFNGTAGSLRSIGWVVRHWARTGMPGGFGWTIFRRVLGTVAEVALRRPRAMLGGAAALLAVLAIVAIGAPSRLGVGAPETSGSESDRAAEQLSASLGHEPEPGMLIVTHGRDPVDSAVYQVALDVLTSQAKSDPEVAAVRRGQISEDGLTTVLEIYFRDDDPAVQQEAVDRISDALDPGPLTAQVAGEAATELDARRHRDELESDSDSDAALRRAVRVIGRPVVAASLAGGVVPLALLAVPLSGARSAAIGAGIAALLAMVAALAVTPSLLAIAGSPAEEPEPEAERPRGIVPRVTGWIGERRLVALLAVVLSVAALLAAAWSALDTETVALGATALPADADARRAEDRLEAELGVEASARATVALPTDARSESDELRAKLKRTEGVASVRSE